MSENEFLVDQKTRMKEVRSLLGISQAQLAKELSYSLSSIAAIEAGNQKIPISLAYMMQDCIVQDSYGKCRIVTPDYPKKDDEVSLNSEWLYRGKGFAFDKTSFNNTKEELKISILAQEKQISIPFGSRVVYYEMNDDTMSPEFKKKDVVAIDTLKTSIISGRYFLVNLYGEHLLRQVFKVDESKYIIKAIQEDVMPRIILEAQNVDIIGEYVYSIRCA